MARFVAILKLVRLDLEKLTVIPSPEMGPKWVELVNNSGDTLPCAAVLGVTCVGPKHTVTPGVKTGVGLKLEVTRE